VAWHLDSAVEDNKDAPAHVGQLHDIDQGFDWRALHLTERNQHSVTLHQSITRPRATTGALPLFSLPTTTGSRIAPLLSG
jgi:hypothetical protein